MLDTGASQSVISTTTLKKINKKHYSSTSHSLTLGDGKTSLDTCGSIHLAMFIKNLSTTVTALVVKELAAELILGLDWIMKYDVHVMPSQRQISIQGYYKKHYVTFAHDHQLPLKLAKNYHISPKQKCLVQPIAPNTTETSYYFQAPNANFQHRKRISIFNGTINIIKERVEITVFNHSQLPITLQRNTILGFLSAYPRTTYSSSIFRSSPIIHHLTTLTHQSSNNTTPSKSVIDIIQSLLSHLKVQNNYQKMFEILQRYSNLFDTSQPRQATTPIHHVIDTADHRPINARPYFKTVEQRKDLQLEIQKMLHAGIIIPSTSPWSSPVILIKKPDGEFRFIVDYRKLNEITKKDSYPQPTTEELLQRIGNHSWFTKLDLKSGYFQIPIRSTDKEKTAFCTQDGLYQFEVLPQGLSNAPPTFQRVMNNLLANNRWDWLVVYLDDILIFSHTFEEHLLHVAEIMSILHKHNFQLNPKKCIIAVEEIEFLSHTITATTIKPSNDKIKPILDMAEPRTLKQANQFLGKLNWYRRFIPGFAQISAPLHKVTNKTRR
ncbi:unnamed protein product, partial [Didymodactylos carnosus]